jgi:hypothetical protein
VIAPDLRGYGDTEKPHTGYDKRTMANDVIALMDHLGHERIALIGHDRGARVGTRFAKDHRARIDRFVAMDNIPTRVIAETYDANLARQGYRFFTFLGVPDLPEALIAGREEIWLTHFYRSWSYNPDMLTPEEVAVYVRAYQQPGAVRGSCMDYLGGVPGRRPGPRGRRPTHRLPGGDHVGRGLQRRRTGLRRPGRLEGAGPERPRAERPAVCGRLGPRHSLAGSDHRGHAHQVGHRARAGSRRLPGSQRHQDPQGCGLGVQPGQGHRTAHPDHPPRRRRSHRDPGHRPRRHRRHRVHGRR